MSPRSATSLLAALLAAILLAAPALAGPMVIAETSFEEPTPAAQYVDTGDPMVDHALLNNAGQTPVNYTSIGGELGFTSFYFNTRNSTGLTDGDFVGPTAFTGDVGAFTDGTQGFQIQDADGKMTVTLDTVDLTGFTSPSVSLDYFVVSTNWESDDLARIWVEIDGGTEIDILNTTGSDIDDLMIEGSWELGTANLTGATMATLRFELDSNAAAESIYIDNIMFLGTPAVVDPVINEFQPKGTEFVELYNPGSSTVDVSGWYLDDADCGSGSSTIGVSSFGAGDFLVINSGGAGDNFSLDNAGDFIVLCDDTDTEIDRVAYGDEGPAPIGPSASGGMPYSVARVSDGVDTDDDARDFNIDPTPTSGSSNDVPANNLGGTVLLNEIDVFPTSGGDMIEIYNPTGSPVDVSGWLISDGDDVATIGTFPAIPAGGFLALDEDSDWTPEGSTGVDFASNDVAYLFDPTGVRVDQIGWMGEFEDDCFARLPDGAGPNDAYDFATQSVGGMFVDQACTLGATNGGGGTMIDLVINEVDYDTLGGDNAEFVELKNVGVGTLDLSGLELQVINGNGGGAVNAGTFALSGMLAAGDYYVICQSMANTPNCDQEEMSMSIQNGSPDAVAVAETSGGAIVDTVSYEGDTGAPYTETAGINPADNNDDAFFGISRSPDGTDTDDNSADFIQACITPGEVNTTDNSSCPDPGFMLPALVINEVDYDQPGTDDAEFVEILNNSGAAVDLSGYEVRAINGSGGGAVVSETYALSGMVADGDYFVLCQSMMLTPNCDQEETGISLQNGPPDAVALAFTSTGEIVDTVSYEGDTGAPYTETAGINPADNNDDDFFGISRAPDGTDTDDNSADFIQACITPGEVNTTDNSSCPNPIPAVMVEIFEIQGDGLLSPFDGANVITQNNVVTAVGTDGFFMQTPAARDDGDPDTSNGIFVFTGVMPGVSEGDLVDVEGTAVEFFEHTQITATMVTMVGTQALPTPIDLGTAISTDPNMPTCDIMGADVFEAAYECLESMYVTSTGITISGSQGFGSDPIAEPFVVAGTTRSFREPGIEFPGLMGLPVFDGNVEVFEVDPDKLGLPNIAVRSLTGYTATGGLGFDFGQYEIWPNAYAFDPDPTLPVPVRARNAGELTVGSLNMFRFFDDVDDPGDDQVVSTAEYDTRRAKFVQYILDVLDAPDILGVQEVESLNVLNDLAADIALVEGTVNYTAYLEEGNDVGGIDVGFLVRDTVTVDTTTQLGALETLTFDGSLLHDRPPFLLEGRYTANGVDFPIAVMVNHNRSLGGIDDPADGPRVRQKRLEQAQSIAQKVQDFQTMNPTVSLVLVGDNNAFEFTDGYVDVIGQIVGDINPADNLLSGPDLVDPNLRIEVIEQLPAEERYSFIFRGNAQTLDHALTSTVAQPFVRGMEFGRGNADAPEIEIDTDLNALYSSDHDGFVLYLMTDRDGDGIADDVDNCPDTVNTDQANNDGDSLGNVCDNCPDVDNEDQANNDGDSLGNACDNCPDVDNEDQANNDGDMFGNVCDNCPDVANDDQANNDGDLFGNACDNCPDVANNDQADMDMDMIGNVCDNCPDTPNTDQANNDGDMFGNVCDNCPDDANDDQADIDMDGLGDACDDCNNLLPPELTVIDQTETSVTVLIEDCAGVLDVQLGPDSINVQLMIIDGMLGDPMITVQIDAIDPNQFAFVQLLTTDGDQLDGSLELEIGLGTSPIEIPTASEYGLGLLAILLALAGAAVIRRRA
ncbi:MAG: IPTL-CTERM sorting domain-containing protein [Acidobacteriota bacterium]